MNTAAKDDRVDEARDALVSDIEELKSAGASSLATVESKLPWVAGGAVGLLVVGLGIRVMRPPRRELFVDQRPSFLRKAIRAAALAATGILVRRYVQRLVDRALPEAEAAPVTPSASPAPSK